MYTGQGLFAVNFSVFKSTFYGDFELPGNILRMIGAS